ncbi:MAG TPA: GHKL domain-containing protein [Bacteroidetes bacterium]|nr:GHKL domain-containing protein [Bacteroidota bacterium]
MFEETDTPLFNVFLQQIEVFTRQDLFLRDLLKILKDSIRAAACSIRFIEEDRLSIGVSIGYQDESKRNHTILIDKKNREILNSSEPLIIPDITDTDKLPKRRKQRYKKEGFRCCAFIPLFVGNRKSIGILSLYFNRPYAIGEARVQILQIFAKMFAYLLHKSILYEDVQELKQLVESVVNFTTDAIILTDELGKILYVSKQVAAVLRKRNQSLIGNYVFQFDSPDTPHFEAALKKARRRRTGIDFSSEVKLAGGRKLFLHTSMVRLNLYRTKRDIFMWLMQDMTSLQQAELELDRKKGELEDFVYSVSHDLKTPIVSIQGYAALLKQDLYKKLNDTHRHYFDRMLNNTNLMQKMIQDLLELSRIGKLNHEITTESFGSILDEALEEFSYQIEKRKIKIIKLKRFPRVRCNRKNMSVVLGNLIGNAIKFSRKEVKTVIEFGSIRKKTELVFFVKDNGIGLTESESEKIFNVFYRTQESSGVEGTGIGLTFVKKIIQYQDGKVWVESEPGKGSTFYFSLPKKIAEK